MRAPVLRVVDERLVEQQILEARQPDMGRTVAGVRIDADGLFAFALMVPLLFMAKWGPMGAAAFAGLVPLYVWVRRERLVRTLAPRAFLLIFPALALFSVTWSQAPSETFKTAIELGLTVVAGLLLSSARNQGAVVKGLAAACFFYVLTAIIFGGRVAIGVGAGGSAFSGLTGSKNLLGDIASTGLIISSALVLISFKQRQLLWGLIGFAAILPDLYVVMAARSAGALLGVAMAAASVLLLAPLLKAGGAVRGWLTGAVALCLVAAGLSYRWLAQALIETGARMFDKDPTLTGRTYLWYRADDLIRETPILGRGYGAFWLQGNLDAEGLWRYFGIDERGGFTFHNTAVELLVSLGFVGLVTAAALALLGAIFLVKKFVQRPSIALVCWIGLFLYQAARMPIESIGIAPFYFSTVLAFGALGAGFGRVRLARRARPAYQPYAQRMATAQPRLVRHAAAGR